MASILWASGDRPALGSMSPTTAFTDVALGDTTTFESGVESLTFTGTCAIRDVTGALTAVYDFGCLSQLSDFRFTISARPISFAASTCLPGEADPIEEATYAEEAEYSADGVTWTPITLTQLGVAAGTTIVTGLSVPLRYLRIVLKTRFRDVQESGTIACTVRLSDFRATAALLPPQAAPFLHAQNACEGTQNTLVWDAVTCATGYDVERDSVATTDVGNVLTWTDSPVTLGVAYNYRVRAYNAAGDGPWSDVVTFTPCTGSTFPPETGCHCTWTPGARPTGTPSPATRDAATWNPRTC